MSTNTCLEQAYQPAPSAPLLLRSAWGTVPVLTLMQHAHALLPPATALLRLTMLLRPAPPSRASALSPELALMLPLAELMHAAAAANESTTLLEHPLLQQLAATPLAEACHAASLVQAARSSISLQHQLLSTLQTGAEEEELLEQQYWQVYARSTAAPAWTDAALHIHAALAALTSITRAAPTPALAEEQSDLIIRLQTAALAMPGPIMSAVLATAVLTRALAALDRSAVTPSTASAATWGDLPAVATVGLRAVKAAAAALSVCLDEYR